MTQLIVFLVCQLPLDGATYRNDAIPPEMVRQAAAEAQQELAEVHQQLRRTRDRDERRELIERRGQLQEQAANPAIEPTRLSEMEVGDVAYLDFRGSTVTGDFHGGGYRPFVLPLAIIDESQFIGRFGAVVTTPNPRVPAGTRLGAIVRDGTGARVPMSVQQVREGPMFLFRGFSTEGLVRDGQFSEIRLHGAFEATGIETLDSDSGRESIDVIVIEPWRLGP